MEAIIVCLFQLAIVCIVHCLPLLHNVVVSEVFFLRDKIKSELVFKFYICMYTNGCMQIYVNTTVLCYKPIKYCIKIYRMKFILHYLPASINWNLIPEVKQNLLRDQCSVNLWIQLNILETDHRLTGVCELICLTVHPMDHFQRNFARNILRLKRRFFLESKKRTWCDGPNGDTCRYNVRYLQWLQPLYPNSTIR